MSKGRLCSRIPLSMGAPLGNLEGGSYTGDFGRWMEEGSRSGASLSEGPLWGEPGGRAPLLGTPKVVLSKALGMGVCFHRGPLLGILEGRSFPRAFGRREKFLYLEKFLRNLIRKTRRVNGQISPQGPSWGTWRGFVYWAFWEKKKMHIWVHFLGTMEITSYVWGTAGTLARNKTHLSWYQIMGKKRARL